MYLIGVTQVDPIKYSLFFERFVSKSRAKKTIQDGITYLDGSLLADVDNDGFSTCTDDCDDNDYFERGIELTIEHDDARWIPVDVAGLCIEVDFESDLASVNRQLEGQS